MAVYTLLDSAVQLFGSSPPTLDAISRSMWSLASTDMALWVAGSVAALWAVGSVAALWAVCEGGRTASDVRRDEWVRAATSSSKYRRVHS